VIVPVFYSLLERLKRAPRGAAPELANAAADAPADRAA
jgi:hypothetical protein